ncbi:hypothetical protein HDU97_009655, partial [Phlyctochytrium planicorne]
MQSDLGKALDSALERSRARIVVDRVRRGDDIIYDPRVVKEEVQTTMEAWMSPRVLYPTTDPRVNEMYHRREVVSPSTWEGFDSEPSSGDVRKALHSLGSHKAPGCSGASKELWLCAGDFGIEILTLLVRGAWRTLDSPAAWTRSALVLIPKTEDYGGDLTLTRPIALLEVAYKVLET